MSRATNNDKDKAKAAAVGTGSGAGGRRIGKAARRNAAKNACHVLDYLEHLETAADLTDLETYMERHSIQLARVTRATGAGRLKVTLQDGATEVDVSIAGSIKFKGRAATKGDRSNCMNVNDLIVLHGPQAAGKIPRDLFDRIQSHFTRLGVSAPKGFFVKGSTESAAAEEETLGFEWETDEAGTTAALSRDVKAASKRRDGAATGAGGGAAAAAEEEEDDALDISKI
jgi:hypothetical protein